MPKQRVMGLFMRSDTAILLADAYKSLVNARADISGGGGGGGGARGQNFGPRKQFGHRSKCFDTLMVFLKEYFENVNFVYIYIYILYRNNKKRTTADGRETKFV